MTFSAAVDITGSPQLELDFDGSPKAATCTAATNTTTMVCRYTIGGTDSAPDGIAIAANKLTLNGGTITATGSTTINARPRPRRGGDRRRAEGRRHPPDARHHGRRCAEDVDRRHEGDPDVQRDLKPGRSDPDHHHVGNKHPVDDRGEPDWNRSNHGRTHPGDSPDRLGHKPHRGAHRRRSQGRSRQHQRHNISDPRDQRRRRHPHGDRRRVLLRSPPATSTPSTTLSRWRCASAISST